MKITGKILFIDLKNKPSAEKDFVVRTFGLDTSVEINGQVVNACAGFQATNKNCDKLDNFNIGDEVEVDYSVSGTLKEKSELTATIQNPSKQVIYTNLNAYGFTLLKAAPQTPPSGSQGSSNAPMPSYKPTPTVEEDLPF